MHGSRACATMSACLPPYTLMTAAMSSHGLLNDLAITPATHAWLPQRLERQRLWGHHRAASSMVLCFVDHEGGRRKRS